MGERNKGLVLLIVALLIFGSLGILAKLLPVAPLILLFSLQIIGVFAFFFLNCARGGFYMPWKCLYLIGVAAIFILVADFSFFSAVKLIPVANAVFVKFTFPIFVLFLAPIVLKEPFRLRVLYAISGGLIGLGLILYQNLLLVFSVSGTLFALICAVTLACFIVLSKKILVQISTETMLFYRYLISSLILLPIIISTQSLQAFDVKQLALLAGFGALFGVIATLLHMDGLKRVVATEVSVLGYIEPLSATAYASIILLETPSLLTLVGALLIIISGIMVARKQFQ